MQVVVQVVAVRVAVRKEAVRVPVPCCPLRAVSARLMSSQQRQWHAWVSCSPTSAHQMQMQT